MPSKKRSIEETGFATLSYTQPVRKRPRNNKNQTDDAHDTSKEEASDNDIDENDDPNPSYKNGKFSDDEMYELIKYGDQYQWFSSGNLNCNVKGIQSALTELRSSKQISRKLQEINRKIPKIRAALNKKNNKLSSGKYKKEFTRTALYKESQTKWYKLYEEKLGDVTQYTSLPVQSASDAKNVASKGVKEETLRRTQKAQTFVAKKNNQRDALLSAKNKNNAITNFLSNIETKENNKIAATTGFAINESVKYLKNSSNHNGKDGGSASDKILLKELKLKLKSDDPAINNENTQLFHMLEMVKQSERGKWLMEHLRFDEYLNL